jgi:hypothetical protein
VYRPAWREPADFDFSLAFSEFRRAVRCTKEPFPGLKESLRRLLFALRQRRFLPGPAEARIVETLFMLCRYHHVLVVFLTYACLPSYLFAINKRKIQAVILPGQASTHLSDRTAMHLPRFLKIFCIDANALDKMRFLSLC